jgi:PAS domain S-box-containing protein
MKTNFTDHPCSGGAMRRIAALLCIPLLIFWTAGMKAQAQSHGAEGGKPPVLFLGNDSLPPINFMQGGKPAGIVVDLARAIAERMPSRVDVRLTHWAEAQQLVLEDRADALLQINPSPERMRLYDFSDPLLTSEFAIFIPAGRMGIARKDELRGLRVGVEEKGLPVLLLRQDPAIDVRAVSDIVQGFRMLATGDVDAVVADRWVGGYVLAENRIEGVRAVAEPIERSHSAIAVKRGNTSLLRQINAALADIRSDGTYDRIVESWRPKEVVFKTREQLRRQAWLTAAIAAALVAALAIVAALVWEVRRRRRAESALRASERRLIGVLESMPDAFVSFDADMRYTYLNSNAERLQAERREELIGRDVRAVYQDAESYKTISQYERVIKEQKPVTSTSYHAGFDRWVEIRAFPTPDGVSVFYKDVSELVKTVETLRDSEERFRLMGDTIPYGAWMADAEGRNIYISPLFLELVGMTFEQVKEFGWTGKMPPEDVEPTMRRWMECVRTGQDWEGELRFPSPDGRCHTILSRGKSVPDAQGRIKAWVGINLDITERKQTENDLRRSEEALRLANEQLEQRVRERTTELVQSLEELEKHRDDLRKLASELAMAEERERKRIATVLHDEIAQTLAVVKMRIDMLKDMAVDEKSRKTVAEAKEFLVQVIKETRALMNDVGNPLLFDMGVGAACTALADRLMASYPVLIGCDIQDSFNKLDPDVKVILYQVIRELLTNVVKHSGARNARVLIQSDNGRIRAEVRDDGSGFNPQTLGAPTTEGGFGLFSIRERLEAFNGNLQIESAPGTGTVVTASLPAANEK